MQYRQITKTLRVQRPGFPHLESTRPQTEPDDIGNTTFLDLDDPTIVEFDEHCQVDIEALLKLGAIEPYTAPKKPAAKAPKREEGISE